MSNKNKTEETLPVFGRPLYFVSANNVVDILKNTSIKTKIRSSVNHLQYFATDAVMVKKVEYENDEMNSYLINKDTDMEMVVKKEDVGNKVFFDKGEADNLAITMNEEMKENLHEIATEAMELYHNIDDIIKAHQAE